MAAPLKIRFVDFWDGFIETDNYFYNLLSQQYPLEISDNPDYIVYSVYGIEHLKYSGIRIFYAGENEVPDFNICDYAMGFHHLDFGDRYKRIPLYYLHDEDIEKANNKHHFSAFDLQSKQAFCNFIYSNSKASHERDFFFQLLSEYKRVESGGRHRNNMGERVKDKNEFQRNTKFTIAFENSSFPGYTTEKLLHAFSAQTIPIYWGDPLVGRYFNQDAFINCANYSSFEEVVERVKEVDSNDDLYMNMMQTPLSLPNGREEIMHFLKAILTQAYEAAFRRDRQFWGLRYENKLRHAVFSGRKKTLKNRLRKVKKKLVTYSWQ